MPFPLPRAYSSFSYFRHTYELVGYEVVPAPDNFFYSHAYTLYASEPFTHTGWYRQAPRIKGFAPYGGWTMGWDTGFAGGR